MTHPAGNNLRETCLTKVHDDVPVHFQIITLPRQTLVWVGCGTPRLDSLSVATKVAQVNAILLGLMGVRRTHCSP